LIGQRYEVPSAEGLVELGGRLGLLSRPSSAVAAWPDSRNSLLGDTEQDVFTSAITFPGVSDSEPGGSSVLVIALAAGVVVLVGLVVLLVRRRSKSPSAPLP
jgi:hypothetical protein